ncbi:MAG: sugar ABC transporter permease [Anaerolineae bacterium]|mgnify:CR=1 FL=1|nr:sugar ABC transporter permease [Anaerolineae bacterium]MCB9130235.1 sugar ABC transporter permease [Anaerolineales bacterium]MCB0245897.1 sugar ABC transporter permease [Anaerolineae bacterium]MCB9142721.1 sugar ABC transporter permease [Anaerolineales bacterium]MCO5243184.1 sugar ABC transporter permease [Anaerolineae bacterium]
MPVITSQSPRTTPKPLAVVRNRAGAFLASYDGQVRIFLLPFLLGTALLIVAPAVLTVGLAFTQYNSISPPTWVGLDNFKNLLASPLARLSIRNSLLFLFMAVPLRLVGAVGIALLLQRPGRIYGPLRAGVYLPTIIPEGAYALIWLWILNPLYGPLNALLGGLGLPTPDWLIQPDTAQFSFVLMSLFTIGEGIIVALVGLRTIPGALYEAARVDGAGRWQSFWRITLPVLAPWLLLLTFRDLVVVLQNTFTPSFVMTYGGPYYATTFAPLLLFELAFDMFDFGGAAAFMVILYALTALLVVGIVNLVGLNQDADVA